MSAILGMTHARCCFRLPSTLTNTCSLEVNLTINGRNLRLSACPLIISTTIHPINFTLSGNITEDPRECGVKCGVAWMSSSRESGKQQYLRASYQPVPNRHVLNRLRNSSAWNAASLIYGLYTHLLCGSSLPYTYCSVIRHTCVTYKCNKRDYKL